MKRKSCPQSVIQSFLDGKYCDFTITCGGEVWRVHKVVICSASEFFANAEKFAVGKEHEDNHIDLPEDDPEMIRRMIIFLYFGDYDPTSDTGIEKLRKVALPCKKIKAAPRYHHRFCRVGQLNVDGDCYCLAPVTEDPESDQRGITSSSNPPAGWCSVLKPSKTLQVTSPLTVHATMYALADKYQIEGLAAHAQFRFSWCLDNHWNSQDFIDAVQIVYSSTPDSNRGLRDEVCNAFLTYFKVDLDTIPGVEETLSSIDTLSFLLMKSWSMREPTEEMEVTE